jgi:UMF1 family MFS transporter
MKETAGITTQERSWILYDVGNSAFVLVMITAIMPIFYKDFAAAHLPGHISTAHWGIANSTASLVLALLSPILGAMADYKMQKKKFFVFFLSVGLTFNLLLLTVAEGQWLYCLALFVLARIGWAGANVFYDSFIIDVTTKERMDAISSRGYGYGYIGSVIPFVIIIGLILYGGMEDGLPVAQTRAGFLVVALWWALLSIPCLKNLRQRYYLEPSGKPISDSFRRLYGTFMEIRNYRQPFIFLAAYFFYIDGVGTIISMSTAYGRDLGFGVTMLIVMLLFIQIVAFPFSLLFGHLAEKFTARKMLFAGIAIYFLATLLAFGLPFIDDISLKTAAFWTTAFLVASAMGGIQALSRSCFGKLIPQQKSAEFFGFYNVSGKFAAILGPLLMGLIGGLTGDTRWGILSILFLFLIGGTLLLKVEDI